MAKRKGAKVTVITILAVLVVAGFAYSTWRILQQRKAAASLGGQLASKEEELNKLKESLRVDPSGTVQKIQQESVQSVIDEVGKLYTLPVNESPTVATVQDKSKLGEQEFFANAENGDQLIVYEKTGVAILYRPSEKKLVKVGPINVTNQESQATQP